MSRVSIILALTLLEGCKPAPPKQPPAQLAEQPAAPRDLSQAPQPWDGEYVMRDELGEIVQRTVWKDHKLVSAWEVSETFPGGWKHVANDGTGVIKVYYRHKHAGFNWFEKGEIVRGAG